MSIGIKAKWIITHDGIANRLLRDGVVVIEDQRIEYVGKKYNDKVDQWIEAPTHVVTAGFICTHTHASTAPKDKSFTDDTGAPSLYMSSLGENATALLKSLKPEDYHVFAKYSMAELIRSGCTTMLEMGMVNNLGAETTVKYIDEMGIRAVEGPEISDGSWTRHQQANFMTAWSEPEIGLKQLDEARARSFKI